MAKNWWEESALESAAPKNESADEWWSGAKLENAPQRTWGQAIKDTGAQLAEGVNTTLGAIPSVVAPQSRAAGFFRDNAQYWRDQQSDVLKDRIAASDQRIQEAGKDGVLSQIGTAASEYWNDPAQAARLVATNLPSMAATLGTGAAAGLAAKGVAAARGLDAANKAALAAKYGTTTAAATNAALNAGGARGEAFEDLQKTALAQGMTPEQAEQAGVSGSILPGVVGGVAGAISGKIGLEKAILGQATTGAAMRKAAGAFGAELAGEQIEELAPKVATNYQVGQIDPGRTLTDDLGRTMVETAIGSGPGAVVAGGASAMRTGETLPPPGAGEPTTSPGAADPNAPQRPPAAPPEAPDLTTSPGAGVARDGMDFTREVDTSGLSLQDPAELERARAATVDYQPGDTTPQWDTQLGASPARSGLDMPAPEFDTGTLAIDQRPLSQQMGIYPSDGAMSKVAALAVDSGTSQHLHDGMAARAQGDRLAIQPPTASSAVPTLGGPVGADAARGAATAVPDGVADGRPGGGSAAGNETGAAEAGAARAGGRGNSNPTLTGDSRNAQAATPEAAPAAQAVPAAGTGAVEAAGVAPGVDPATRRPASSWVIRDKATGSVVKETTQKSVADKINTEKYEAVPIGQHLASLNQTVASNTRNTGNAADASGAIFAAVDSSTTGVTSEPTSPQAIQASPQPAQAPATQGLTNAPTPQNNGAQAAPATGAQGAAQTAVARPDGWRKSMLRAAPVAKAMGIDTTGKRLAQVVAEIDARDTQAPATPAPAPTPTPTRLGRDNTPLSEGGKPFKTRKAAGDAKKLQPMMRVVTVPGGYALAEKTPAQLAAEERAAKRLRTARTSPAGEPVPAHAFIAASGGLHMRHRNDLGVDGNPRIGNRRLFGGLNRGLSIEQATEMLVADGYLSEGASHNDAYALIKKSLSQPQYNADGIERIAQAESDAQFEDYMAAQEEAAADGDTDPFGMADEFTTEELDEVGYTAADPALQAEVSALIAQAEAMDIDTFAILEDIARTYANATQDQYNAAARDALAQAITRGNQDGGSVAAQAAPAAEPAAEQELNRPAALTSQAQAATENVAPEALELAAQTPAEAAARQDAQEQADKAEAAAKRAEDAAAKAEEDRKRIAQASVRAADRFELGQDPMDSLTGQGSMFDAQEPEQQAPAATEAMQTKEDDAGNVAMFSRTGAKSPNAQQPTTRAWYDRFVSLLPASYRNDSHRREPLPAEDWNVQRSAEVREKIDALNKQLRGANDRKGYGPVSADGLGNLQVDARTVSAADLSGPIRALADELGAGVAATNVRSSDVRALLGEGFVSETSLAAIADRLMQRPFASPTNNYAKDSAPGTVMTYKPRGFPAALFARDVVQNNATPAHPTDSNARNVATQMLVDGLKEKWTRAPEIIVARNMQDPQVPQAVRDYDETLKSQGATGEARGFIYKGKVYLLSDQLKGPQQIAEVLFHEVLGHYGLRGAFGESLTPILQQIGTMRRRDVVAKAREYGMVKKGLSDSATWAAMSAKDRLSAAEEVLAEMAQTQPNIGFVQRAISAIRNWLRANVPGFKSLRLTDADIIQAYILPARGFVTRSKETGAQSLERAMMAFSRTSTATGTQSAWDAPVQTGFDDVIYKLQDKNIDLKRVVEAITKSAGQVADSVNAYLKEELFHKRAAKRVEDFGDRELKPLMNQMRLMGLGMEDVEEYLHARHAKEANAVIAQRNPGNAGLQDGGSGMTNQAADNYFAKLDPAQRRKLEAVAKNVDAIIDKTRKLYVSYGLENQDVVDGWASMYQHYIPLMREDKDGGMGTGQGFSVKGKETKGRTGSTRKVVDILANIASQREKLIVRGEKNIVAQALVGLAQANPNPDFWEVRSQAPTERVFDPKTGVVVDRPDPLFKSRENVAVAKVKDANGKVTEQMVVFNEDNPRAVRMAAAMKNLDAGNLEGLLGMSAKVTRYFSAINTQYNPVFGVVNLVRDVQGAMVNLAATPLAGQQGKIARDTASALRGIYGDIRKTRKGGQATSQWSQLWEQMQDDGGTTGYRELFTTSADRANNLKSILNPEGWMDNKWGKFFTAGGRLKVPMSVAQKGATEIFGWLSDYNEAMENGVRLAAYKAALDKGMSREQAASLAKNLTVNFNRKGQVGQQAGAVYAFFNAAMQGTARIGQTLFDMDGGDISTLRLSKTGKAVVYGGVTLGAIQALALAAAGFDAEDPPEFVRERSLIIPTGGKTYVTIPMPLGLHVIPGIGRHATEFALSGFDKPAKRAVSVVGMFADAFNPIGNAGLSMQTLAPTALDPLVALTENKDWTGNPIARVSSNKALPGHTQWKDTATGFSKVVAEAINWASGGNEYVAGAFSPTPDQIDYLIAQLGGGVAREASKVQQTVTSSLSGETLPTYKVPLVGRFVGNAASQASQGSAFYANLNRLNELETEIKGLRKDGRFDEAAKLIRENPQAIMIQMANRAERDVQRLRREKRELIAKDASREEVRAKDEQITAVMTRLNQAAERRKAVSQ